MSHILNSIEDFKSDVIEGLVRAYPQFLERIENAHGVRAVGVPFDGKVSILIGGGSGHYPAFAGLVGDGLASGAVIGEIFTSPSSEQVYRCTKALDGGAGVIYSYGNYSGDVMNFDMAAARAEQDGITVRTVLVTDDVASAPADRVSQRRGIAGDFCVFKILGAAARAGRSIEDVTELGARANSRTRTIGIAFGGCTVPGATDPMFNVEKGKMELGLGIHGEPGIRSVNRADARYLARMLVNAVVSEAPSGADGRVAVLVNGLGSTTYEELFVLYGEIAPLLKDADLPVHHCEVGELVTSLDMAGCSLTLLWLDDELSVLYDEPAVAAGYRKVV